MPDDLSTRRLREWFPWSAHGLVQVGIIDALTPRKSIRFDQNLRALRRGADKAHGRESGGRRVMSKGQETAALLWRTLERFLKLDFFKQEVGHQSPQPRIL
jgi:hypothetical protein